MSAILFEVESGRLRLDRAAFDSLVAWTANREREAPPELRAAGMVDERGKLHSILSGSASAITEPVCRIAIRVQDAAGRQQAHDGWVASAAAALLLAPNVDDGRYELVNLHPAFLPEAIARLVGLGPRSRPTGLTPVLVSPVVLDDLTSPDAGRRDAATASLRSVVARGAAERAAAQALGDIGARWEVITTWDASRVSSGRRGLHVIDTAKGLWLVEPLGGGLLASPATPTALWRLLTTVLPRDDELGFAPQGRRPTRPTLDGI